jgi:O-antigen/teichoic acid export membrane protein
MSGLALRKNAIWSIAGSCAQQASNLLLLVAISRLLGTEALGQFSYAIALCSPVIAFSTLGLRNLQVIESSSRFSHFDFRRVQFISSLIAIISITVIALLLGKRGQGLLAITIVSASQAITSQTDTVLASFQKLRRMDIVAQCRAITAIAVLPACFAVAITSTSLPWVLVTMLAVRLASLYAFTTRWLELLDPNTAGRPACWSRVGKLAFSSIPIATMTGVMTLDVSIPSLALDHYIGSTELAYYMVISTICLPIPFVLSSLLQASLPYLGMEPKTRWQIINRMLRYLSLLTIAGIAFVHFAGTMILQFFLGAAYSPIENELTVSFIVGFASVSATIFGYALLAKQLYRLSLIYSVVACLLTAILAAWLIPTWGLMGAVVAPLGGKLILALLAVGTLLRLDSIDRGGASASADDQLPTNASPISSQPS